MLQCWEASPVALSAMSEVRSGPEPASGKSTFHVKPLSGGGPEPRDARSRGLIVWAGRW